MSENVRPTLDDLTECWCGYQAAGVSDLTSHQLYCDPHNTAPKVIDDQRKRILDDVLDYYLTATEETGKDVLEEVVRLYPQYELELRELAADQKIFGRISPREYMAEEEQSLTMRAVSVVQNLLYQQRQEKAPETTIEEAFTGLRDEVEKRYASSEEFYEKTWLSEGIIWTLDDRQVRFTSIPQSEGEK